MKKLVYETETGIVILTPAISLERSMKDIPEGVEYKIIEASELPSNRTFRNAWNYDLKEDIPKSKEIWKEKLRADRAPLLSALDVEYQRADEESDTIKKADIINQKKVLRDITNGVDSCTTIAEIKTIVI